MRHRTLIFCLLFLSLLLALPSSAQAVTGLYNVYVCSTPKGAIAPTDGWEAEQEGSLGSVSNACGSGGSFGATLRGDVDQPNGVRAGWGVTVAPDTHIDNVTIWHWGTSAPSPSDYYSSPTAYVSYPSAAFNPDARTYCSAIQGCTAFGDPSDNVPPGKSYYIPNLAGSRTLHFAAGCAGNEPCRARGAGPMAQHQVQGMQLVIADGFAPEASDLRGRLADAATLSGQSTLRFAAADRGGGLYRTYVEARREGSGEWVTAVRQTVDGNGGRCQQAETYDGFDYEFGHLAPCRLTATEEVTLDSADLADGRYEIRVRVEDVAANFSTVMPARQITIDNAGGGAGGGPAPGVTTTGAAKLAVVGKGRRTLRYGKRGQAAVRLVDTAGKAIGGARLEVLQRTDVRGAGFRSAGTATTDAQGRAKITLAPGPSRTVRVLYRTGDAVAAAVDLRVRVKASTTLKTSRSFLLNGQTLRFSGKVRSTPVPRRGVGIDLQARVGRRWQTFETVRTSRKGAWRAKYTFRSTSGLQTYAFRARVRGDSGFPYAASTSKRVKVRVRG